jgi:hypothetical protein
MPDRERYTINLKRAQLCIRGARDCRVQHLRLSKDKFSFLYQEHLTLAESTQ